MQKYERLIYLALDIALFRSRDETFKHPVSVDIALV